MDHFSESLQENERKTMHNRLGTLHYCSPKNSFFQNSKANTILLYLEKNVFPQYPKPI